MTITEAYKTDVHLSRSSSGGLSRISGIACLKKNLFDRLMTVPGTLVHRGPGYGVGVLLWLNGLSTFSKQQKLASTIQEQFLQDPRVEAVTSVSIEASDVLPQNTRIKVFVKPVGYQETEMVFTPFSGGV